MYNHCIMLNLAQALRVDSAPCIAFVGAGGKTTAMFQLARQLPGPVVVTATSHLGTWQTAWADRHIIATTAKSIEELEHSLRGVIVVTGEIDGDRTKPVDETLLKWLHEFCDYHSIPLLIEADGSRQKPLKAWADHEPPIPSFVDHVVQVVGLSSIGKPLTEQYVHRPEIISKSTGLQPGEIITANTLTRLLLQQQAELKNLLPHAKCTVVLNQADTAELQSVARGMADTLRPDYSSVIIAKLINTEIFAAHEQIAGIILAAGGSTRFGGTKQLLDWRGQPFVRAVASTALKAGLSPVTVISGANADAVESAIHDLGVQVVYNEDWQSGQGSSIKAGVLSLSSRGVGGAIFLLADQPQVTTSVIQALVEKHAEGLYPIVAPMVIDQRANPVLFDRATFRDLTELQGDVGGRAIFHKYRIEYLPWHDDRLLLDVDTPQMYQRLIEDDTL